jgi:chromosome segregation ATPase
VPSIIQDLLNELFQGPDHLLREVETFSSLVDDLRGYSWRLSSHESCFLTRLLRLRAELVDKVALVFSIEDAERRHRQTMSRTFDQIWSVSESMRTYESNLAARFHEEDSCDARIAELKGELARLEGRKMELQAGIKEDVANSWRRGQFSWNWSLRRRILGVLIQE